jgi:hypothetical protein
MAKPTLQDYIDSGALDVRPVQPSWLVRTAGGLQFCTPKTEEDAKHWAEKTGGTYEWFTPVQATTMKVGQTYDH